MFRTLLTWLVAGLFVLSAAPAVAGPGKKAARKEARKERKAKRKVKRRAMKKGHVKAKKQARRKLRRALRRTNRVLRLARAAVKKGGAGKAELRQGVHHQRAARRATKAARPKVALHLTRKARGAGFAAIKANKGAKAPAELAPDAEEQLDGEADAEAAGGFLKEAEEGLPTEDAVANDESVGADTPEEAAEAEEAAPAAPAGE